MTTHAKLIFGYSLVFHRSTETEVFFFSFLFKFTHSTKLIFCPLNSMLADKLNMSPEEAERWIVNLICNARLDAKIDSKLVRIFFDYLKKMFLNSCHSNSSRCSSIITRQTIVNYFG